MKTTEKKIKEVELTQKDLIAAIKNYVEPKESLTGIVTITCKTENGGRINILPINKEEGEEIITYIRITPPYTTHTEQPKLDILKSDKANTSPIVNP